MNLKNLAREACKIYSESNKWPLVICPAKRKISINTIGENFVVFSGGATDFDSTDGNKNTWKLATASGGQK